MEPPKDAERVLTDTADDLQKLANWLRFKAGQADAGEFGLQYVLEVLDDAETKLDGVKVTTIRDNRKKLYRWARQSESLDFPTPDTLDGEN
jgi:hypothetical protein